MGEGEGFMRKENWGRRRFHEGGRLGKENVS